MDLPELPPGSALDPGWSDSTGSALRGAATGRGQARMRRVHQTLDEDDIRREAMGQVLREERIAIWRKLWAEAKSKDDTIGRLHRENAKLRKENRQLRLRLGIQ